MHVTLLKELLPMVHRLKRINYPLLVGGVLLLFVMFAYFFPHLLTDMDPNVEEAAKYIEVRRGGELVEEYSTRPFPPNEENRFGSDEAGRDLYSRLIYGTRNTLRVAFSVVLFRMLIAMPMGIMAGMGGKTASIVINTFNTLFTAIPKLLISFVILNVAYFRNLEMQHSIWAFAIVLTVVGWSKVAALIEDQTSRIMQEDFIEGEIAAGKSYRQIGSQNLMPHLIPHVVSYTFMEIGMVLFLLAQLAVLTVFVGPRRIALAESFSAGFEMAFEPEWGSMLARAPIIIRSFHDRMWLIIYPALTFFLAITGFNLTGEGLRIEFQKRSSRVVSFIRQGFFFFSPRIYIEQWKNLKTYWRAVGVKTLGLVAVLLFFFFPPEPSMVQFNTEKAFEHLEVLTDESLEGRVIGFEGGRRSGDYIIHTLQDYGLEPWQGNYYHEFPSMDPGNTGYFERLVVEKATLVLEKNGIKETFHVNEDFFLPHLAKSISLDLYEGNVPEDGYTFEGRTITYEEDHIEIGLEPHIDPIPLIKAQGRQEVSRYFYVQGQSFGGSSPTELGFPTINAPAGVPYRLGIIYTDEFDDRIINTYSHTNTHIIPFGELREKLENADIHITLHLDPPKAPDYPGRNIMGFLPGRNWENEGPRDLVIIGAPYDGFYTGGREGFTPALSATAAATSLELARALSELDEPLEKSIMFIFFDGEQSEFPFRLRGSFQYNRSRGRFEQADFPYTYIEVGYTGNNQVNRMDINFVNGKGPGRESYFARDELLKRLNDLNVDYRMFYDNRRMTNYSLYSVSINSEFSMRFGGMYFPFMNLREDTIDEVNEDYMKDLGQIILDTVTLNPLFNGEGM